MDSAAHWLRDSVIRLPWPVAYLSDQEAVLGDINRPWHGFQLAELLETLYELFRSGDLAAIHADGQPWRDSATLTRQHIWDVLTHSPDASDLCYALTPQGGVQWEIIAQPEWNRFTEQIWSPETHEGRKLARTRTVLKQWIASDAVFSEWAPIPGTEIWTIVAPWSATYWKTFPRGHCVHYRYQERESPITTMPDAVYHKYNTRFGKLHRWYTPVEEALKLR